MKTTIIAGFAFACCLCGAPLCAQITLVEEGGTIADDNVALWPGSYPFAIDSLAGFPIHDFSHLNDGIYGNNNSWIGNSGAPAFAGIGFDGKFTIRSIAFGRDNTGTYFDRCQGLYTLQVTTVSDPNEFTPDEDWVTVGTIQNGPFCPPRPSLRHRYNFPPVEATGIRLLVPETGLQPNGTCIDELEVYEDEGEVLTEPCAPPPEELTLLKTGGPGPISPAERADEVSTLEEGNVARAADAVPFSTPPYPLPIHETVGINDGLYGNDHSWLGNEPGPASGKVYGGVYFTGGLKAIEEIALGRDNLGRYVDRAQGPYIIEYTQDEFDPSDDASTDGANWVVIGQASAHLTDGQPNIRHVYGFSQVQARAVRVITLLGNCFDEIEVGLKLSQIDRGAPPEIPDLILAEEGGTLDEDNLAQGPSAYSFAIDSLAGFPIHDVSHLNDGLYGNDYSWIGNTGAPGFAGINLGGRFTIRSIAFGRDNTGTYADRAAGRYVLQVTTAADPNELTPESAWITVGKATNDAFCPPRPAIRHRYNFDPVEATGIRLLVPETGLQPNGTCIDELEVYEDAGDVTAPPCGRPEPLELLAAGGPVTTPALEDDVPSFQEGNEARSPQAVPFGTPPFPDPAHTIEHLNDGLYGNAYSWLGNELGPASGKVYAGIYFADGLHEVSGIALGRDNTGVFIDRAVGAYLVQYTQDNMDPADDWSIDSALWITLGTAEAHLTDGFDALRHAYRFPAVEARAVRVLTQLGAAIDEIELAGGGGPGPVVFHRGDPNSDGSVNITDGIYVLNFLFLGGPEPTCLESADVNDDGSINITDGIYILNFLFLGGPEPAAPGPPDSPCGPDPPGSPRDLGCAVYTNC